MIYTSKSDTVRRSVSRWLHQRLPNTVLPICVKRFGLKMADAIMPEKDKLELQMSVLAISNAVAIAKKQATRLCKKEPRLKRWFCDEVADKINGGWLMLADGINLGTLALSDDVFCKLFSRYVTRLETFEALVKYFALLPQLMEEMGYYNKADEKFKRDFSSDDEKRVLDRILNDLARIVAKEERRSSLKSVYDEMRREF